MKQTIKRVLVIIGNIILALLLALNLLQVYRTYQTATLAANQQLLSSDPNQFLGVVQDAFPSIWLWLISGISLVISLFILIGWFIPKLRRQLWFWRLNFIWLWSWVTYLIVAAIVLVVLVNSFF